MEKVINLVRNDIKALERANIGVSCGEYEIRAIPKDAGRWKVSFRRRKATEGVGLLNDKQLEYVITELLRSSEFSEFNMITQRDRNGYYMGNYYQAIQEKEHPKRKFDALVRRLVSATSE